MGTSVSAAAMVSMIIGLLLVSSWTRVFSWPKLRGRSVASDCAANIKELWAIRHSDDVCYHMPSGYDSKNRIDCPLNPAGVNISVGNGTQSQLWKNLSKDDLILVSPMNRTRGTLYFELFGAGLLGSESLPHIMMDSALIEIGSDAGNIGTHTSEWSENYTEWAQSDHWYGGGSAIEEWNAVFAQSGPIATKDELATWQFQTKNVHFGNDISPQSLSNKARLHDHICEWVQAHPSSTVVLVSHHVVLGDLFCLDDTQAGEMAKPFRIDEVADFMQALSRWPIPVGTPPSTPKAWAQPICNRTFSR